MNPLPLPRDPVTIILEGSRRLGIELDRPTAERMIVHLRLVEQWGKRTNLTSLKDLRQMAVFHLLDSLTVLKVLPLGNKTYLADIGSGAGFPGVVLKLVDKDLRLVLLDRNPKKIVFLKHVAARLGFSDVAFLNIRLESLLQSPPAELFDVVVSRALSSDPTFFSALRKLVAPSGALVRMAGPSSLVEELGLPDFTLVDRWEGILPFSDSFRSVSRYRRQG